MRVFIAVDLSNDAKKEIAKKLYKVLEKKHWSVKWEKPEKLHLTLVFFSKIEEEKIQLIKEIGQQAVAGIKPFFISFKGLGCFPNYDWPRVIWLGLKGNLQSLAKVQKNLDEFLKKVNFDLKTKPFSPHITLGRIKKCRLKERQEIGRQLKNLRILNLESKILINKLIIYQSTCLAGGSVYKKLAIVPLPTE